MKILDDSLIQFVNLDSRPDRLALMWQTLARAGIHATRRRGMLPSEYTGSPEQIAGMWKRPQKGAIGCYFSQLAIMKEAKDLAKNAFVMEDDLVICADFMDRLAIIEEFCNTHRWDVIWFGGTFHVNPPYWHKEDLGRDAECTDHPRMLRTYGSFSTHAYLVNRDSLPRVLKLLATVQTISWGIDHSFIKVSPRLHTYAFVPGCIIQYDNQSNIGNGVTVYSNFKKLGPYWFQQKMTEFDPLAFDWHEAKKHAKT